MYTQCLAQDRLDLLKFDMHHVQLDSYMQFACNSRRQYRVNICNREMGPMVTQDFTVPTELPILA